MVDLRHPASDPDTDPAPAQVPAGRDASGQLPGPVPSLRGDPMSERNPDGSYPELCTTCGVDHRWTMADLSHANIALMLHAQERFTWMEYPINGDMIARQRAGILNTSLLFSTTDPEEIDWDHIAANPAAAH